MRSCRLPFSSVTTTQLMLKGRLRWAVGFTGQRSEVSRQVVCASCVVAIVGSPNKVMQDMIVFLLSSFVAKAVSENAGFLLHSYIQYPPTVHVNKKVRKKRRRQ
jgi:hypothetical protein